MNNFKTNLDRLISRENGILAKQGLNTNDKFPGTFCRTQAFEANPELFYLVLDKVQDGYFKVIPGNLDGFTAGPKDLVLPRNILGGYVSLATDLVCTLPEAALGKCFAILEEDVFHKVHDAVRSYPDKKSAAIPYGIGLPYINAHETRKIIHDTLCSIVKNAQEMTSQSAAQDSLPDLSALFKARVKEFFRAGFSSVLDQPSVSLAAGKEEIQAVECSVEGMEHIALFLEFDKNKGVLTVELFDKQTGEPLGNDCQDWKLFNSAGEQLGILDNGAVSVEGIQDFNGVFCLMDTENGIHEVYRK